MVDLARGQGLGWRLETEEDEHVGDADLVRLLVPAEVHSARHLFCHGARHDPNGLDVACLVLHGPAS